MATISDTSDLPFHLRSNYAPVLDEIESTDLVVTGQLPAELNGRYFRNGPNPHTGSSPHWFVGDGMIHGMRLRDGKAEWYRNRFVQTRALNEPDAQMMDELGNVDYTIGVANTHIVGHAGKILAVVESSFPCELDADLSTVGVYDFDGKLDSAMTAHPKVCPVTGEMHFFGYSWAPPYLRYHRVSADGQLVQSEDINVPGPTMVHDFSITESHVIFMDLPVVFNIELAMAGSMPYTWDDDYGARVGVMKRGASGDSVRWFDIDPCYVFHPLNSFDLGNSDTGDGSKIVIDTARYRDMWRADSSDFSNDAALHRWTLDLDVGTVKEEALDDRAIEFPRVPDALVGLPNRYGYAVATFDDSENQNNIAQLQQDNDLVKYDLEAGTSDVFNFGTERIPGEPVFVPAADAVNEDDGYLMTYVYDKERDGSDFVVLNAADPSAEPLAVVELPRRVPFGFHGNWFADA